MPVAVSERFLFFFLGSTAVDEDYQVLVFMQVQDAREQQYSSSSSSSLQFNPTSARAHPILRLARREAAEQEIIPETDISNSQVRVWVVTTAW